MVGGEFDLLLAIYPLRRPWSAPCSATGLASAYGSMTILSLGLRPRGRASFYGYMVVRTGIPSFLMSLGTFFVLQGANPE